MSKELKILQEIRNLFTCHDEDLLEKCNVIETALKRLEVLDNIQSEPLKALKKLNEFRFEYEDYEMCETTDYMIVENALIHHEHNMTTIIPNLVKTNEEQSRVIEEQKKELKALEIIREKFDIEVFEMKDLDGKVKYIIDIRPKPNKYANMSGNSLTQEKFDLLKEVFADESK